MKLLTQEVSNPNNCPDEDRLIIKPRLQSLLLAMAS
jgi:hypothetical protein